MFSFHTLLHRYRTRKVWDREAKFDAIFRSVGVDDKVPALAQIIAEEDAKAGEVQDNVKEDENANISGLYMSRRPLQRFFSDVAPKSKPATVDSAASSKLTASLGIADLPHGARPTHYLALKLTTPAVVDAVVDVQVRFATPFTSSQAFTESDFSLAALRWQYRPPSTRKQPSRHSVHVSC